MPASASPIRTPRLAVAYKRAGRPVRMVHNKTGGPATNTHTETTTTAAAVRRAARIIQGRQPQPTPGGCGSGRPRSAPMRRDPCCRRRLCTWRRCGFRARLVARFDGKATLERRVHLDLDLWRLLAKHFRDLGHDQKLRAVEHPLLAERQALRLAQER